MAHTSRSLGEFYCLIGVTRRDHGPTVDKNLGTNLFRYHLTIHFHGTAHGGVNTAGQAQVGGMLSGVTHATPPQHAAFLNQVIEPALANFLRRNVGISGVIF